MTGSVMSFSGNVNLYRLFAICNPGFYILPAMAVSNDS